MTFEGDISIAGTNLLKVDEGSSVVSTVGTKVSDLVECGLLLHPAPATVSLLSQLIVHSSRVDVSLEGATPINGWLYVKNPQSLRASLLQVGNSAWEAFRKAHRNMDTIQLTMALVPTHLQNAMKLVRKNTPAKMLATLLPKNFERVTKAAQKCQEAAEETEDCFDTVIKLLDEISQSVATTDGMHERQQRENEGKLKGMGKSKARLDELAAMAKSEYDTVKEEISNTRELYKKATDDLPTGWNAIAQDAVRSAQQAATNAVHQAANAYINLCSLGKHANIESVKTMVFGADEEKETKKSKKSKPASIINKDRHWDENNQELLLNLQSMFNNDFANSAKQFISLQGEFKCMLKLEKDLDVRKLLTGAIKVAEEIEKFSKSLNEMDEKDKRIINLQLEKLIEEGIRLASVNDTTDAAAAAAAAAAQGGEKKKKEKNKQSKQNNTNEVFMINLRKQELREAEQKLSGSFDKYTKMINQLSAVEKEMAELDVTNLNLQDIRTMLRKVIVVLGQIKEHWGELVMFFSKVAVRTEALNREIIFPALEDATSMAECAEGVDKEMLLELLSEQEIKINGACFFLHMVAKTYVKVSEQYILGQLAGLAKLLGASDDQERHQLLSSIQMNAKDAKDGIEAIVQQQHNEYREEIEKQMLMNEEEANSLVVEEME